MAMRGLAGVLLVRLPALGQHGIIPVAGPSAVALPGHRHINAHTGRLGNPWEEVLQVAKGNPEKLREIIDTLTSHCIKAQSAPPLHHYNELLRICEMHSDVSSVGKLCQMACAVKMHMDDTTYDRLISLYSYFPKPYPTPAPKAQDSTTGHGMAQHATGGSASSSAGSSSSTAAAGSSSGSSSARPGAILEAPASSSMPSVSATGGASSVSISSSGAYARPGARLSHTPQTNVWIATSDSMSSTLPHHQGHLVGSTTPIGEQQPQQPQQQQQSPAGNAGSSSVNRTAARMTSSVSTQPDAAA